MGRHSSDALRLFFLNSHYRSPLVYREDVVEAHERAAERLRRAAAAENEDARGEPLDASGFRERFVDAMDDDLNTPRALAVLFDMSREMNRARGEGLDISDARSVLQELAGVLGLTLEESHDGDVGPLLDLFIETRAALRKNKQYDIADSIRDRLSGLGYILEDGPSGTTWKRG